MVHILIPGTGDCDCDVQSQRDYRYDPVKIFEMEKLSGLPGWNPNAISSAFIEEPE